MNEVDNAARGDVHDAVGSYVVHALDEPELREFEAHLDGCDQCLHEVYEFNESLAELSRGLEVAPPPALRASVLDAIGSIEQLPAETSASSSADDPARIPLEFSAPTNTAGAEPEPRHATQPQPELAPVVSLAQARERRRAPRALIAVAAAVALIAVAAGGWAVSLNQRLQTQQAGAAVAAQQAQREADLLRAPDAKIYTATLGDGSRVSYVVSKQQNSGVLLAGQVGSPGAGKIYQIWTVGDASSSSPKYSRDATFGVASQQRVFLTGDLRTADALGISIEPAGSTPSQPTTTPTALVQI